MSRSLARQISASVDAPVALTPHLGDLFRRIPSLGSFPGRVVSMLARAGLRPGARVLDLACGQGAIARTLAARCGCLVLGVDACAPFVAVARAAALRRGVADRCTFRVGDLRRLRRTDPFDAALMIGLDPVERAAPKLRTFVRPGGLYLVDDLVRTPDAPRRWHEIPTLSEAESRIHALGDPVIAVNLPTPSAVTRQSESLRQRLGANARRLARREPSLRPALRKFLSNQDFANRYLGGPLRPVMILAQRSY